MCFAPCYDAIEARSNSGGFVGLTRPTRKIAMRALNIVKEPNFEHRRYYLKGN
jgi:hypothetical protein